MKVLFLAVISISSIYGDTDDDDEVQFIKDEPFDNIYKPDSNDLIFTPEQKAAMKYRSAYSNITKWPNGVIPYTMTDAFRGKKTQQKVLTRVIAEYAKVTCIRLVPRTTEANYVEFQDWGGCSSYFGVVGGKQALTLDDTCVMFNYGTTMHEIMHTLGFMHEQMRPDRDYFINIKWENVPPTGKDQFIAVPYKDTDFLNSYYDFNSLMHYPRNAFTGDYNKNTIETKDPQYMKVIGQREYFSDCDIAKINRMYNCGGNYKTTC
jgi:hypothetical protein